MDLVLKFLYNILPFLHVLAGVAFVIKVIIIFRKKGIDPPAVFVSLFRIYTRGEKSMTKKSGRLQYMKINNYINYYLYAWAFITIIMFLVFHNAY